MRPGARSHPFLFDSAPRLLERRNPLHCCPRRRIGRRPRTSTATSRQRRRRARGAANQRGPRTRRPSACDGRGPSCQRGSQPVQCKVPRHGARALARSSGAPSPRACLARARSRGDTRRGGFLDDCLEPCYPPPGDECRSLRGTYGIVLGKSWGLAADSAAVQVRWEELSCDELVGDGVANKWRA